MKKTIYFIVYWFGSPIFQSTDELIANAYANTYNIELIDRNRNKSIKAETIERDSYKLCEQEVSDRNAKLKIGSSKYWKVTIINT